ncbi:MAG: hypothetical protein LQ340_007821, partial [Diploschistes diacapsis]
DTVNQFIADLGTRLEGLQEYGRVGRTELDAGITRAYTTLQDVRERCSVGDFQDVRLRAKVLVETVESTYPAYKDRLPTYDSLEARATACVQLLESFLGELEARRQALREAGRSTLDESWRRAEDGLRSARDLIDDKFEKAKEGLRQSIAYAREQAQERGLISYEDLPTPWRINPHITKGYRFCESSVECVVSVFTVTNESVNIWSHALGFIFVLMLAFYYFPNSLNYNLSTNLDIFFVALFFVAACKCLVCSCMWHTMNSIADQTLMERFACVDYTGISLLIAASIMTTEHAAFYCEPTSRWVYVTATAVLGIGGVIVPWHPFFNREDMAWARVAFYLSLGATGFVPVIELIVRRGPEWAYYFYAPITMSVIVYITGAVVYAMRIPEKFLPGWFDYFGGSHNIWHFAVLGGILFHYHAMSEMFSGAFERALLECPTMFEKFA